MAQMWNKRNLPLPARSDCRIDDRKLDLKFYQRCLCDAMYALEHPHLQAEAALLSRCIYRMKTKFRNDKGVKELQKINTGLRRYLTLDLPRSLERFLNTLPAKKTKGVVYPTLGNLDYLLTRLQGTVKLLSRIAECAKYSVHYMNNRISIGHFWNVACIVVGMAARVFALMKSAVKICCNLYNDLFGLRGFLKGVSGYEDEEHKLPEDLKEWLDDDWLFEEVIVEDVNENLLRLKKTELNDVEFCDEYVEIDDDIDLVDEYIDMTRKYKNKVADSNLCDITIDKELIPEDKSEITNFNKINKKIMKHTENDFYSENGNICNHKSIKSNKNNSKNIEFEEDIGEIIVRNEDQSIGEEEVDTSDEDIGEIISRDEDPSIENSGDTSEEDIGEPVENEAVNEPIESEEDIDETIENDTNEEDIGQSTDSDNNTQEDFDEPIGNVYDTCEEDIDEPIGNDCEDFDESIGNDDTCEKDIDEPTGNDDDTCNEDIDESIGNDDDEDIDEPNENDHTDTQDDFGEIFIRNDGMEKFEKKYSKKRKMKSNDENVPKKKFKPSGNKINKDNIKSKKKPNREEQSGEKQKIALSHNFNEINKRVIKNINQHSVHNHKIKKTTIKDDINVHNTNEDRVNADQIKKVSNTNGNNLHKGINNKRKNNNIQKLENIDSVNTCDLNKNGNRIISKSNEDVNSNCRELKKIKNKLKNNLTKKNKDGIKINIKDTNNFNENAVLASLNKKIELKGNKTPSTNVITKNGGAKKSKLKTQKTSVMENVSEDNLNVLLENGKIFKKNKNSNVSSENKKESKKNTKSNVSSEKLKKNKNLNVLTENVKKSKKHTNSQNSECASKSKIIENKRGSSAVPEAASSRSIINSIHTISELKLFVKKENKLRGLDLKKCKLKHLNKMQWNMLSNLVNGFVNKAKKNEKKSGKFLEKGKEALLMNL